MSQNKAKILDIDPKGRIFAYDKNGELNTDFNINTITKEDQIRVFGYELLKPHQAYAHDAARSKILDIDRDGYLIALDKDGYIVSDYNVHTMTYDDQMKVFGYPMLTETLINHYKDQPEPTPVLFEQNTKSTPWAVIIMLSLITLLIAAFVIFFFIQHHPTNDTGDGERQQAELSPKDQGVKNRDVQLENELNRTKQAVKDDKANKDDRIKDLKQQVDNLKHDQTVNQDKANVVADKYHHAIQELESASKAKDNGDESKMQQHIDAVDSKVDDIRTKLSEWFSAKDDE